MTKLIDEINLLAKKEREVGLTAEEKHRQEELRNEYRANFRKNLVAQLENTYIQDENGNKTKLEKKPLNTKKQ